MKSIVILAISLSLVLGSGCYFPNKDVVLRQKEQIAQSLTMKTPAKVYLKDTSIVLFQHGFALTQGGLEGEGVKYAASLQGDDEPKALRIPLEDIAAVTYHRQKVGLGDGVAAAILDLTGPPLVYLAITCLANPKSCFGSCPTVYIKDGPDYRFCSELFSYSVCPYMEADDFDLLLPNYVPAQGALEFRLTNEALESHHINEMRVVSVRHPQEADVYPSSDNRLIGFRRSLSPENAMNSLGTDVLPLVKYADGASYRSPDILLQRLRNGPVFDSLDLTLKPPRSARAIKLLLRARNTLLSTVLFYDIVLASQGIEALGWTERMNTDPQYARLFQSIYNTFSGIDIKVFRDRHWMTAGRFHDMGPIADKYVAAVLPCQGEEEVRIRLQFVPDNFLIDSVSFDYDQGPAEDYPIEPLEVMTVIDNTSRERKDILPLLSYSDDLYLTTEPGESYRFYCLPPDNPGTEYATSLFVASRGYYTEWLRGRWIVSRESPGYSFRLNDFAGTFAQLAERWLRQRVSMEKLFFTARVKLREEPCSK